MAELQTEQRPMLECLDDALSFRNDNREVPRNRQYYEWRYVNRPCEIPAYVTWVREHGRPIGAATVAPHDFLAHGKRVRLGIVGDISVSSAARGKGVGSRLLAHVRQVLPEGVDDVIVLPNEAATGALRHAGWTTVGHIRRYVRMLAPDMSAGLPARLAIRFLAGWADLLQAIQLPGRNKDYQLSLVDNGTQSVDDLWQQLSGNLTARSFRSGSYFRWRFRAHPSMAYEVAMLSHQDELCGYVVWHTADGDYWIDDYLTTAPRHDLPLMARTVGLLRARSECGSIQWRSLGTDSKAFSRLGFFLRRDTQPVMIGGRLGEVANRAHWFITAGDKDV